MTKTSIKLFSSLSTAMVGCVLMASAAFAEAESAAQAVKFKDLDLGTAGGVATLYRRLHTAAAQVCLADGSNREADRAIRQRACIEGAEARAVRKINVDAVTAYFKVKTGQDRNLLLASLPR